MTKDQAQVAAKQIDPRCQAVEGCGFPCVVVVPGRRRGNRVAIGGGDTWEEALAAAEAHFARLREYRPPADRHGRLVALVLALAGGEDTAGCCRRSGLSEAEVLECEKAARRCLKKAFDLAGHRPQHEFREVVSAEVGRASWPSEPLFP
jgi:hypothetical protein